MAGGTFGPGGGSVGAVAYGDPEWRRRFAWASTAVSAAGTALYLVLIISEADDAFWDVFPWALSMVVGTAAALTAALVTDAQVGRRWALTATALLAAGLAAVAAAKPKQAVAT